MKKFFSFVAAAMLSVCAFADRAIVPNPSDLASLDPTTNVVLCVYFDEQVCNDIVLIGDFNGWSTTAADLVKMRPLAGFDGWYAASVAPDATGADKKFKPVQLKADGSFAWDFQCGGPDAWVKANPAGADLDVQSELGGAECGLHYTAAGAYIYYCTYWKNHNTPCAAAVDYTIKVYAPECEYVEPTIAGGFDNWTDVNHAMDFEIDDAGNMYYYFIMENQLPGTGYKIKGGEGWGNAIEVYVDTTDSWWAVNDYFCGGKDWTLGEETEVVFYWNDPEHYRYNSCEEPVVCDSADYTVTVTFPACAAATPAIVGSFNGWTSVAMTATANPNEYTATVKALCTDLYKFNDVVLAWENEIINVETGKGLDNIKFGEETTIVLDYSNGYVWKACQETAIENVEVKAAAVKSIENGRLVIKMGDKKFTVLGAEL